jgi:hypothetical protein
MKPTCNDSGHPGCIEMTSANTERDALRIKGDIVSMLRVDAIDRRTSIELYEIVYNSLMTDIDHSVSHYEYTGAHEDDLLEIPAEL